MFKKKYTYIPDGDYEGLKWMDGKCVHIEKVFSQKTAEGQEPVPQPIRDARGNIDDSKLSTSMPEDQGDGNEKSIDQKDFLKTNTVPVKRYKRKSKPYNSCLY